MFQPKHKLIFGWLDHKFPHFHCQLQGWSHFHQLWNWGRFYISFLLRNLFFLEVHFLPESRDKCYNLHYAIVPIELASKLGNLLYIDQYCTTSLCIHGGILPKKREKHKLNHLNIILKLSGGSGNQFFFNKTFPESNLWK